MATDHRGRGLHAGKRTAQESAWEEHMEFSRNVEAGAPSENDGFTPAWRSTTGPRGLRAERAIYSRGGAVGKQTVSQLPEGKTMWSVTAPSVFLDGGTTGGRYSESRGAYWGEPEATTIVGTVSTPRRAAIASEAMKNRIAEGRDLKTGRPKSPKAPKNSKKDTVGTVGPGERDVSRRISKGLGLTK